MATTHEKALAAEWLAVMVIETGDAFARHGKKGQRFLPQPQRYFATMVAYLLLAGVALFGPRAGKVASALGALVALTILMAPPTIKKAVGPTNEPLIVSFLGYLAKMFTNPPITVREPLAHPGQVPTSMTFTGTKVPYTTRFNRSSLPPAPQPGQPFRPQQQQGGMR